MIKRHPAHARQTGVRERGPPSLVLTVGISLVGLVGVIAWSACERSGGRATEAAPAPKSEPPRDPNQRVDAYVREELDAELQLSPTTATWLGVHAFDDRLDELRPEVLAREASRLRAMIDKLHQVDRGKLDAGHALDAQLLERRCQLALWELTELRPYERNPVVYIDLVQGGLSELLSDEWLPPQDRLRAITARLWKARPLFDEARRNLRAGTPQGTSELAARKAIELGQSLRQFLADTLPRALQVTDAKLMDDFRNADGDAARALDDFAGWLQRDLLPRARGDVPLGRERLMERLRLAEALGAPTKVGGAGGPVSVPEWTPEQLVMIGERELRDARRRYDDAVKQLPASVGARTPPDITKLLEDDHARPDDLLREGQSTVEAMVGFVRDHQLFTLPQPERPRVIEMPPWGWGFAQLDVPGPLERAREAYVWIDPVDKAWPDRRKQEHLRAANRAVLTVTLVHDVIGHYVENDRDRRAPTTMQKIALASSFVEGWPSYVERMMLDQGYGLGDPKLRIAVERGLMVRTARLVAAVRLHALSAKLDDVAKLFADEALLEDYQARREAERVAIDPMVISEALGRIEIERLRGDWRAQHPDATLGQFHDALLAHGSIPVEVLRGVLLK